MIKQTAQIKRKYWEKHIKGTDEALAWTPDYEYEIENTATDGSINLQTRVNSAYLNYKTGEYIPQQPLFRRRGFKRKDLIIGDTCD